MTVVLQMEPLWGNAATVAALYGIPRNRLLELAKSGHIRARKLSPDSRSATIVFRTADVKDWLENEAAKPRQEAFEPTHVRPPSELEPIPAVRPPHALQNTEG
jgi:hypothetical protein